MTREIPSEQSERTHHHTRHHTSERNLPSDQPAWSVPGQQQNSGNWQAFARMLPERGGKNGELRRALQVPFPWWLQGM